MQKSFEDPNIGNRIEDVEIVGYASPTFKGQQVDPKKVCRMKIMELLITILTLVIKGQNRSLTMSFMTKTQLSKSKEVTGVG